MYSERIQKRKEWLEALFKQTFNVFQCQLEETPHPNWILLGCEGRKMWAIDSPIELTTRENIMLQQISREWLERDQQELPFTLEEEFAYWINESIRTSTPLPKILRNEINWDIERLPIFFTNSQGGSSLHWVDQIIEVLTSYLPADSLFIRLNSNIMLILVPLPICDEVDSEGQNLREWISGLVDVCQNELSFITQILYHTPFVNHFELLQRVDHLMKVHHSLRWQLPTQGAIPPWTLILELIIDALPEEDRTRILSLYDQIGSLSLLEQMEWIQTLQIFLDSNLNISLAAKQLYIHRNTLLYRLDRITEETGLDPRSFRDAVYLRIAILLLSYKRFRQNTQEI